MAFDYGYGELNNRLIELFRSGAPDFEAAKELINQGADLNIIENDDDENILSVKPLKVLCLITEALSRIQANAVSP